VRKNIFLFPFFFSLATTWAFHHFDVPGKWFSTGLTVVLAIAVMLVVTDDPDIETYEYVSDEEWKADR
jgi:hypothetical protein